LTGGVKNVKMQISSLFEKKFLLRFTTVWRKPDFYKILEFGTFLQKKHTDVPRAVFFELKFYVFLEKKHVFFVNPSKSRKVLMVFLSSFFRVKKLLYFQ